MPDRQEGKNPVVTMTLVSRQDCCLCDEMKVVVERVAHELGVPVEIRDVDAEPDLYARFSNEVPVLLVNGRKAFKLRLTEAALRRRLGRENRARRLRRLMPILP